MRRIIRPLFPLFLLFACGRPTAPSTTGGSQPTTAATAPLPPSIPVPVAPADNGYASLRPPFVVQNATHGTRSWAALQYRFDVATDAAFANVLTTGAVAEGINQTTFTPSVDLPPMTTIFWRVQAVDSTNDLRGGFAGGTFVTPFVGAATLHITATTCTIFMSDLLVDGSVSADSSALTFRASKSSVVSSLAQLERFS